MWNYIKSCNKPIVLYGMGSGADKIIDKLEERNIKISGIFASDEFVRGHSFHGFRVKKYAEIKEEFGEVLVLVCFGTHRSEVIDNIKRIAKEQEVLLPDVPVIGGGLFDREYAASHRNELEFVYSHLCDDLSKKTFKDCISYRLSGNISYLFDCESTPSEAYETVVKPEKNDIYMDLGAYNGDTVAEFIQYCPDYKEIIAVEPDRRSFRKLTESTKELRDIKALNVGISHSKTTVCFEQSAGRQSKIGNGEEIPAESVDSILNGGRVDFINADVEGAELDMIKGAKNTILQHRPKMLISAYHRTEDYFSLVKAVLDIRDDYKVYMRHFKSVPAWDTVFYFV